METEDKKPHDRFRTAVSILIAAATVVGAAAAWRTSVASGAAGSADSKGLHAALQGANAAITVSTYLSMNLGFFADYREHLEKANLLEADAAKETDGARQASLREEAVRERNLAATARSYVDQDYLAIDPETGLEVFDGNRYWEAQWAEASAGQDLDEASFFAQADHTRTKARALTGVTVGLGTVLFLLTASTVAASRARYVLAGIAVPIFLGAVAAVAALEVLL